MWLLWVTIVCVSILDSKHHLQTQAEPCSILKVMRQQIAQTKFLKAISLNFERNFL